jgi:hypothetical protein
VSNQPFEREVAAALDRTPRLWVYHPWEPEGSHASVPADFFFGHLHGWGLLEVKQTALTTLPARQWTVSQRRVARDITAAGGHYWLLVRFLPGDRLFSWAEMCRDGTFWWKVGGRLRHDHPRAHVLAELDHLGRMLRL